MAIKLISWNIYNFGTRVAGDTTRASRVLDAVSPAAKPPAYDVFVVLEPKTLKGLQPGELGIGDGPLGLTKLLAGLQARHAGWRAVPPVSLAFGQKSEAVGVFYDSDKLELEGPRKDPSIPGPWNAAATGGVLYWADIGKQEIQSIAVAGGGARQVVTNAQPAEIALDAARGRIYWVDAAAKAVRAADAAGTNQNVAVVANTAGRRGIALDAKNGKLYVSTAAGDVERVDPAAKTSETLLSKQVVPAGLTVDGVYDMTFLANPAKRAIQSTYPLKTGHKLKDLVKGVDPERFAVDLESSWMYWTDSTAQKIERAGLDGSARTDVATGVKPGPFALAPAVGRIFWVEQGAPNKIRARSLDGTGNIDDVVTAGNPVEVAVDPARRKLYWIDDGAGAAAAGVWGANLDGGNPTLGVAGAGFRHLVIDVGSVLRGQVEHEDNAGNKLKFHKKIHRRPYLVQFKEKASGKSFLVVGAHTPAPKYSKQGKNNFAAQTGTAQIGLISELAAARTLPVVVVGDFNCCTMPKTDPCGDGKKKTNPGGHDDDVKAYNPLVGELGAAFPTADAIRVLRAVIAATSETEEATLQAGLWNAAGTDPAAEQAATSAALAANQAGAAAVEAAAAAEKVVANAPLRSAADNDGKVAAGLAAPLGGQAKAAYQLPAANAAGAARKARNSALKLAEEIMKKSTPYLQAFAEAVVETATAVDQAGKPAATAAAKKVGDAALRAEKAAGPVLTAANAAKSTKVAGNSAKGAVDLTAAGLAKAARDSIRDLAEGIYVGQIVQTRTSMKAPGKNATLANHTSHAYDHIFTVGFTKVENAKLRDLVVELTEDWKTRKAKPAFPATKFTKYHKKIWKGEGVSDHLPVVVELTL
ncbi:MAG TPA: hypothetical protein VF746_26005 [Longimicrobium sp.]|jgi:hypothetical protein